jgi:hypothetical protein
MTTESFRHKIKRYYRTDDIVNYIMSLMFLGMGIYFLGKLFYEGLPKKFPEKYLIILAPLIPIASALYAFWRIPKDYIVYRVDSNLSKEEKIKLIEDYLSDVQVIWKSIEGDYRSYRYKNKFWSKVDLRIYVDDTKLLYNVHGADSYGLKGVFDFGLTRRAAKRLMEHLNTFL